LDDLTGGLRRGQFTLLASRPGIGKTSLALSIAKHVATQDGNVVALFSLELSSAQVARRLLSQFSGISLRALKTGSIKSDSEWVKLSNGAADLASSKIHVDDAAHLNVQDILQRCRELKDSEGHLDLVVVDYIQLMRSSPDIAKDLKILAKDLNAPVLLLSQLNRSVENRSDKRPMLSDLRDSSGLEAFSELVVLLYRDEVYNRDTEEKGTAELIVSKNRSGECGTVKLGFCLDTGRFVNLVEPTNRGHEVSRSMGRLGLFTLFPSNQNAYELAQNIASGHFSAPLLLKAGPGLGKTHLLEAIKTWATAHQPGIRIGSFSVGDFTNGYLESLRNQTVDLFRKLYRADWDVVLVDDLTAILGQPQCEDELHRTLGHFEKQGKRIVIATSAIPKDEPPYPESEFRIWLKSLRMVEIHSPSDEECGQFVAQRLRSMDSFAEAFASSEGRVGVKDVVDAVLRNSAGTSFRELESKLVRLEAKALMSGSNDWTAALEELKKR
ncbi:MAG: DnaB-like helicase C-terminal domain-containing protein, partial [Bdellovibrionota bacterium]